MRQIKYLFQSTWMIKFKRRIILPTKIAERERHFHSSSKQNGAT